MSPQLENGYLRIANEILDAMIRTQIQIPTNEMKCLLFIIRRTYGFNKKEDAIAHSQFALATGIQRCHIARILKRLDQKRLIITTSNADKKPFTYALNKNYKTWEPLPENDLSATTRGSRQKKSSATTGGSKLLPPMVAEPATTGGLPTILQKTLRKDRKTVGRTALTIPEVVKFMKSQECYRHIDVEREAQKAILWTEDRGRQFTKRFFLNWLNRIPVPLSGRSERVFTQAQKANLESMKRLEKTWEGSHGQIDLPKGDGSNLLGIPECAN